MGSVKRLENNSKKLNGNKSEIVILKLTKAKRFFLYLLFLFINMIVIAYPTLEFNKIKEKIDFFPISVISSNIFVISALSLFVIGTIAKLRTKRNIFFNNTSILLISVEIIYILFLAIFGISGISYQVYLILSAILPGFSILIFLYLVVFAHHFKFFNLLIAIIIEYLFIFFVSDVNPLDLLIDLTQIYLLIILLITLPISIYLNSIWRLISNEK
ncbi:MAG: hypothetical protein ACTSRZ_11820 [Promethearchaeota archaeon]